MPTWDIRATIKIDAASPSAARTEISGVLNDRPAVRSILYEDILPEEQPSIWKPIHTGPKDGTKIIGYFPPLEEARTVSWDQERQVWETLDHDVYEPTAWIPQRP